MNSRNYIYLTKPPTKEDYFRAKLLDIPFVIGDKGDIVSFDLIDMDQDVPFGIKYYPEDEVDCEGFELHDIQYRHGVKVERRIGSLRGCIIKYLYLRGTWLAVHCPDFLKYCQDNKVSLSIYDGLTQF